MTYHWVCNKSKTTGATSGAGTAYPSEELEFVLFLVGFMVLKYLVFCGVLSIIACTFTLFLLAIVLSFLRFTDF
jgi:hypothetical protein